MEEALEEEINVATDYLYCAFNEIEDNTFTKTMLETERILQLSDEDLLHRLHDSPPST
jgi:hypothetical protein